MVGELVIKVALSHPAIINVPAFLII